MKRLATCARYSFLLLFAAFLCCGFLLDMLLPDKARSELENRPLAQRPAFSVQSLLRGTYAQKYEEYINDQFIQRNNWIALKSLAEATLGKTENNGVVYGKQNYLFEKALTADAQQMARNIGYVCEFAQKYPERSVTLTVVPNSYAILRDLLPNGLHNVDQLAAIEELYATAAQAGVKTLDAAPYLSQPAQEELPGSAEDTEYLYYRTDHHWTTPGAYQVYAAYMHKIGLEPVKLKDLTAHEIPDFYGTYYSKAKRFGTAPDTLTWYDIPVAAVSVDGEPRSGLYNKAMFDQRDKYAAFLHGNNALTVLKSAVEAELRSRVLLIKDSYGNCFAPFLLCNFDEVVVIDLRYFTGMEQYLAENIFDEIYILYNFSSFSQETSISGLRH